MAGGEEEVTAKAGGELLEIRYWGEEEVSGQSSAVIG